MRRLYVALVAAIVLSSAILAVAAVSQPAAHAQQRNAYWPYSVEISVSDK